MNPQYRFFLQMNDGGEKIAAKPIYEDSVTLDYELEQNQRFYRAKLSGKFDFIRQDYIKIMAAEFDTVYYFYIEKSDDGGQTWKQLYKSMFMRTDCTINVDDQVVSVQPNPIDQYNDVLAGLEKEYNLISLAPEIERLTLQKRPLIQIYVPGENIVSCFIGGLSWEQDCNVVDNTDELISTYHFALITELRKRTIGGATGGALVEVTGDYIGDENKGEFYNNDGYKLTITTTSVTISKNNITYYSGNNTGVGGVLTSDTYPGQITIMANVNVAFIYGRYLLDVEQIEGLTTYPLPTDDIVTDNRNYKYAIGYAMEVVGVSLNFSDTPTEYGLADNNKYYLPPYSIYGQKFYPIGRTRWRNYSLWFAFHAFDYVLEESGRKQYTLRDSYPVSSVISVLLKQFAPEITHEATPEYSRFLYGGNNPITGDTFRLLVTPKSNIIVGDYQTPVQKSPATLKQFLDMLRNTFQLYWHIEDNKLRIEHVSYYRNGGTYAGNPVVGYDLTTLENVRNGKFWAFATSEYSFDKQDMPERYQFSWGDDVTDAFDGQAIEIVSKYVQPGKIEEINIGGFNPDIDLMLLNPEAISQDGYALFAAQFNANTQQYELPFVRRDVDNITYYLQNGFLAMVNLQPQYWLYDMPARNLKVNGLNVWAYDIQRKKSQNVTFPIGDDAPELMRLIKTNIGNGQIEKISINLSSRMAEATIKHDTE